MENLYATVVTRLLASGRKEDEIVGNLVKHLKAKGRVKLLPGILSALKIQMERNKTHGATVEVSAKEEAKAAVAEETAAAEHKARRDAETKAAEEERARKDAEAKAADAEAKAADAEVKAAAEVKARQDAEARVRELEALLAAQRKG